MNGRKNIGRIFVIAAFIGVVCLLAGPVVAASPRVDAGPEGFHERGGGVNMSGLLDHLEELGFDLSSVSEALSLGNNETARSPLDQFMQAHRDEMPAPPIRETSGETSVVLKTLADPPTAPAGERGGRMLDILEQFEELGYNMSAIRAAIAAGDTDSAQSLMLQFLEEHGNELPAPPAGDQGDRMTHLLDQLEEQGYDVSTVRAAVESGDCKTARTLLDQFMEEHRDEQPEPPAGPRPAPAMTRGTEPAPG
jgi:DNA-binding transcriptional MerR regulator